MASNITTSSVFTTASVKPDPGEQADAIWAQKLAENTGYLMYRRQQGPSFQAIGMPSASTGSFFFRKTAAYGTMTGTVLGVFDGGGGANTIAVRVDGTTVFNHSLNPGTTFKVGFGTSISHLTNDTDYELTYSWSASDLVGKRMSVTTFLVP